MNQVTVGSYLAQRLEEVGVRDYFAIPSDFNLSLLDEMLKNTRLKMINCCNELNAGYPRFVYYLCHRVYQLDEKPDEVGQFQKITNVCRNAVRHI